MEVCARQHTSPGHDGFPRRDRPRALTLTTGITSSVRYDESLSSGIWGLLAATGGLWPSFEPRVFGGDDTQGRVRFARRLGVACWDWGVVAVVWSTGGLAGMIPMGVFV